MRVVFVGKGSRCAAAMKAVHTAGHEIVLVMVESGGKADPATAAASELGLAQAPNGPLSMRERMKLIATTTADVTVLAGFSQIVPDEFGRLTSFGAVNLHAGRLPQYRGSSPLNWALINGESSFGISVIRVDQGLDTGAVLAEAEFVIGCNDTVADLHETANLEFGKLLTVSLDALSRSVVGREQQAYRGTYWPLRFPEDGFIVWDMMAANEVHNLVRALANPYPNATTRFRGQMARIVRTRLADEDFRGVAGRIYRITGGSLLVAASDRCLWVDDAVFADSGVSISSVAVRYDEFATCRGFIRSGIQ